MSRGPREFMPWNAEVIDYLSSNRNIEQRASNCVNHNCDDDDSRSEKDFQTWVSNIQRLNVVCNGDWSQDRFQHYCTSASCCDGYQRKTTIAKIVDALCQSLLHAMPVVPAISKWTKTGPCVDTIGALMLSHSLLNGMFGYAFSSKQFTAGMIINTTSDQDQSFVEEVTWHHVAGTRYRASAKFLAADTTQSLLTVLMLCMESLRFLHADFLACASRYKKPCRHPALCDHVHAAFSPVTVVLQYVSTLLSGAGRPLALLWMQSHSSMDEWVHAQPLKARQLQRALLVLSSMVYRRHALYFRSWPWPLASLVDERLSVSERQVIAQRFWSSCKQCLDELFGRRLREQISDWQDLFQPSLQAMMLEWARSVIISMAAVEFEHGKNARHAHAQMPWQNVTAMYINRKASLAVVASCRRGQDTRTDKQRTHMQAKSPYKLFRLDCIAKQKLAGKGENTATK